MSQPDDPKSQLLQRAGNGDPDAQCKVALSYELGLKGTIDYDQALIWWTRAAEQGSAWALRKISELIENGHVDGSSDDVREYAARAKVAGYRTAREQLLESLKCGDALLLQKKVLIIDDEPIIRQILRMIIEPEGFRIIEAENGHKGLKCLSDHPDIALIILDLVMQEMSGFQFLQTLRNIDAAPQVPIVISTGHTRADYVEQCKKLGINGWIMKPFQNEKVLALVRKFLGAPEADLSLDNRTRF